MAAHDHALQELSRAPLAEFLTTRKRLSAEVRGKGDASGAAEIAKRRKPTASVWAVNQLYWQARVAFDDMISGAARLRKGDVGATKPFRDATAALRKRAATILKEGGLGASDAVLRRVTTTLAAIGAAGGFDPDPPGALSADRDPPGFDAVGVPAERIERAAVPAARSHGRPAERGTDALAAGRGRAAEERAQARADEARRRAAEEAERERRATERVRRKERDRLEKALGKATAEVGKREHALAALEKQLRTADQALRDARQTVKDLELQLTALDQAD